MRFTVRYKHLGDNGPSIRNIEAATAADAIAEAARDFRLTPMDLGDPVSDTADYSLILEAIEQQPCGFSIGDFVIYFRQGERRFNGEIIGINPDRLASYLVRKDFTGEIVCCDFEWLGYEIEPSDTREAYARCSD